MGDFGGRLRQAREGKGWSKYRLAKQAGISEEGIAKLEREGNPRLDTLAKLAGALDVSVAMLAGDALPNHRSVSDPPPVGRSEKESAGLPVLWQGDAGWFVLRDAAGGLLLVVTPDAALALAQQAFDDISDVFDNLKLRKDFGDEALQEAIVHLQEIALSLWFGWLHEPLQSEGIMKTTEPLEILAPGWWIDFCNATENPGAELERLLEKRNRRKVAPRVRPVEDGEAVEVALFSLEKGFRGSSAAYPELDAQLFGTDD